MKMGKHRISNLTQKLRAAAAILMVSSLGLFYPGTVSNLHAQSPNKPEASSPAGGPNEGIKVHGRWTIEIRNPDGKLVTHREFENALRTDGVQSLGHFLRRTAKPGEWAIHVYGTPNPCFSISAGWVSPCSIYEPSTQVPDLEPSNAFKTLAVSSQSQPPNNTVLTGTATATRDGIIQSVRTDLSRCPVDTPGVCANLMEFTSTNLATPINVVTGQIIQVTVVISFS
jgi:hypothetical protein